MASHSFIISYLLAPGGSASPQDPRLGVEWGVGFRGQEYKNVIGLREASIPGFNITYHGGGSVGVSPNSADGAWDSAFPGSTGLSFCGYYWYNNDWFGGFIDWWPINEGLRNSRPLTNADGQFELAYKLGIRRFAFCFTDFDQFPSHPLTARTKIIEITL